MSLTWFWSNLDVFRVVTFIAMVSGTWVGVGVLKSRAWLRIGDARKINHVAALAGGVLWFSSGDPLRDRVSCHVAVIVLLGLLMAACRWREWGLFRYAFVGYARESDRPHDGFHVWFSWIVSIVGLKLVDVVFDSMDLTRCVALVLGLADAVGEPIGSRFGRHRYAVRDVWSTAPRQRSWEGTLAVAAMTALVVFACVSPTVLGPWSLSLATGMTWSLSTRLALALLAGVVISLVEAWTPHGLDNLTIPLSAAVLVRGFLVLG